MSLSTPRWWYLRGRRAGTVLRLLLTPASWIWAAATARRITRGARLDPSVPVICVGNLTLGGAGKTPVAMAIQAGNRRASIKGSSPTSRAVCNSGSTRSGPASRPPWPRERA